MMHHSFQSNFCNPNSGHEKGSVENKVGYHRRNLFVPVPEFKDLKEYNRELLKKCDKDMERLHYKHSRLIRDMFVEDKAEFLKLPKTPIEVFIHEFAKADNYGKVKFDGRTYSATPELSGKILIVKAGAHDVEIMDQECNHIVSHKRLYGDEKESMNWIPYLEVLAKRPTAIKYTGLFNQLPSVLKEHLDKCSYEDKKALLRLFAKMAALSGMEQAIAAMEESLKLGVADTDSIWVTYCRLNSGTYETELKLPPSIPELKEYLSNISTYDILISRGGPN